MLPALGKGTRDRRCSTAEEIGRVCLHRTVRSCTSMPVPTFRLVAVRQVEQGNGHVAWRTPQVTIGADLVPHCSAVLASGGHGAFHDECPDEVAVWATLWGDMVAGATGAVYNPHVIARHLAEEGQPTVTLCQCSGRCQCVRKAPKFQWKLQSEMA